jgi:hippurate hydrolase
MISFPGAGLPILLILWVGAFGGSIAVHAGVDPSEVGRRIDRELTSLQVLYRELHQRPELSYQEAETARRVADELERAGVVVTRRVGGHGVVGVLTNGVGPVLLLRADLDGLPIREQTGLPFSSTHRMTNELGELVPTMHACGHDIHMASLIGSARVLAGMQAAWKGTVIFLGQPAEERGGGARPVSLCIAMHRS